MFSKLGNSLTSNILRIFSSIFLAHLPKFRTTSPFPNTTILLEWKMQVIQIKKMEVLRKCLPQFLLWTKVSVPLAQLFFLLFCVEIGTLTCVHIHFLFCELTWTATQMSVHKSMKNQAEGCPCNEALFSNTKK